MNKREGNSEFSSYDVSHQIFVVFMLAYTIIIRGDNIEK